MVLFHAEDLSARSEGEDRKGQRRRGEGETPCPSLGRTVPRETVACAQALAVLGQASPSTYGTKQVSVGYSVSFGLPKNRL